MKIKITMKSETRELYSKTFDETNSTIEELEILAKSSHEELFYFLLTKMGATILNGHRKVTFDKEITFDEPINTLVCKVDLGGSK